LLEGWDFFAQAGSAGFLVGEWGCCNGTNGHF
jgi:hypothetical protein